MIKIIVDSTADLRPETAARVDVVPLSVFFGRILKFFVNKFWFFGNLHANFPIHNPKLCFLMIPSIDEPGFCLVSYYHNPI